MYNKQMQRIALVFICIATVDVYASQEVSVPGSQELLLHKQSNLLISGQQNHDQNSASGEPRSFFASHWRFIIAFATFVLLMITKFYMYKQIKELAQTRKALEAQIK